MKVKALNGVEVEVSPDEIKRHAEAMGMTSGKMGYAWATEEVIKNARHELLKMTDYALNEREKDGLREQIIDGKISKVQDSVICLAGKVDDGFKATNAGFAAVNARINDITVVYVPQSVICDKDNCCNKPQQ